MSTCGKDPQSAGCEVCKPAVGSIISSLFNKHLLDGDRRGLTDTNDRFLANVQRNGTFSVIPRIGGGEITPEKLLVIATVAKKYGLYTKITGGQRIDMYGALVVSRNIIPGRVLTLLIIGSVPRNTTFPQSGRNLLMVATNLVMLTPSPSVLSNPASVLPGVASASVIVWAWPCDSKSDIRVFVLHTRSRAVSRVVCENVRAALGRTVD